MAPVPDPPEPPVVLPEGRTVYLPGRGESFVRDTGGEGPPVLLLHGWMVTADLNWLGVYGFLRDAGYRVLAMDHRGHGRGLRTLADFRLVDCAADAAALLRALDVAPALVVGYSMGGAIAQIMAAEHADVVRGVVLSATSEHWRDKGTQRRFRALGILGVALSLAPRTTYGIGFRRSGVRNEAHTAWMQAEMMRHSARDVTEAGRELGRFDSRAWLRHAVPTVATVMTTRDTLVPVHKQRSLAAAAGGPSFEVALDHLEITTRAADYNPVLLEALRSFDGPAGTVEAA